MIQRNIISSPTQPIELQKIKVRNQNILLGIAFLLGITILFSLYVYQTAALYSMNTNIINKQHEFARTERLKAEALSFYAQTRSMETMIRRAEREGFAPPEASQFYYVQVKPSSPALVQNNTISVRQ